MCCITMLLGSVMFASAQEDPLHDDDLKGAFFETEVLLDVDPAKAAYDVEWSFVNLDRLPIKTDRIVTSCNTLLIKTKQRSVPGRRLGVIKASFRPSPEYGVVRETVRVYFVGFKKPVELVLEASIPAQLELTASDLK